MVTKENSTNSKTALPILERTVKVSRVAKVIKGGRTLRFAVTVVVGNGNGEFGIPRSRWSDIVNILLHQFVVIFTMVVAERWRTAPTLA